MIDFTPRSDLDPQKLQLVALLLNGQVAVFDAELRRVWFPDDGFSVVLDSVLRDAKAVLGTTSKFPPGADETFFHFLDHPSAPATQMDVIECQCAIVSYIEQRLN